MALLACAIPDLALAQAGPAPQAQGLFQAGGGAAGAGRQSLTLSVSLVEAYDSNLRAGATAVSPTLFQQSGSYTSLTPTMSFASRGRSAQITATSGSTLRYYRELDRLVSIGHNVGAGVSAELTRRTRLSVNQGVAYAPSYLHGLFANAAPATMGSAVNPATSYAVNGQPSYQYSTSAGVSHAVTRRDTVSFNSAYRYTDFVGNTAGASDLRSYDVGGRFTHLLSRDGSLRLGYTYRQAAYSSTQQRPSTHDIDSGIAYQWPLSSARRTTLGFSAGSAVVTGPVSSASTQTRRQFRLVVDASLNHQMGRTWQLQGAYHRGVGFIEGIEDPVFSDAVTVTTSGSLDRRTTVVMSTSYSTGNSALAIVSSNSFDTYTGDAEVRFAISRTWATYVDYMYYFYNFNQSLQLSPGVSPNLRRHSVRAGLTLSVSLMGR
ncbi:MAG: hypothetical protein A3H95_05830 [Acidobacteria bacterium RIFCSPLOWO2_02_FULL_64_15]|nr:MAG: hypothetical protein A3H95_05830 [Acidobacteria bacterium RIFCSPLOWO2_02_FULL_64_15]